MVKKFKAFIISFSTLACLLIMSIGNAAVPSWTIDSKNSSLMFTATQNNAPVQGEFKTFTGTINFDPNQLAQSSILITVDMASVSTSYNQIATTLKTPDFFDVAKYTKATFKATKFTKTEADAFQAQGNLTLRDKTLPLTLNFSLPTYTTNKAIAKGQAIISRTQFGVGQGEWANTDSIKDPVHIDFTLTATR